MTRIRNILQQRASRYRTKQAQQEQTVPLSYGSENASGFTEQLVIKPRPEQDASMYLEAKTATETFSSEEENTAYSNENDHTSFQDGGEFIDLAYEASRQGKKSSGDHNFINLAGESNYRSFDDCRNEFESKNFAQPQTIEFVDSEDGKVFNITQEKPREATGQIGILQNVRSLDDANTLEIDECSKTLNTNNETLQSMPSLNEEDIAEMKMSNRMQNLHVDIRDGVEEEFEECDLEDPAAYEHGDYNEIQSQTQDNSQLYDCDDGEMYYDQQGNDYGGESVPMQGHEEDGNFFEQLRSNVQSRQVNDYQNHQGVIEEEVQAENWQAVANQVHYENPPAHTNNQLEDPYMSDGNSSWEEGSFATGASRNVSRVDSADDDDVHTYETFDGSEYYSDEDSQDDRQERPILRMLKKIRHDISIDDDDQSRGESSDDEYEGKRKRSKGKRRRRKQKKQSSGWLIDNLREIGTDVVDEAIEFAESQERARGEGRSQADVMIDSFANLFSCGGIH